MALKIPWDQDESVILLDALIKVRNGELARKEAVEVVSKELRQRAINKGTEIDDIFRNKNGISLQMSFMEYVLTDGKQGMPKASKLFNEIVVLYKENRSDFEKILQQAKNSVNNNLAKNDMEEIKEYYDRFEIILKENFPNGFRPNSAIDKEKFKRAYLEHYGSVLLEDDEFIIETLNKIGIQREGRICVKNNESQQQVIEQITNNIDSVFNNGATCVYIEAIWVRYQNILSEKLGIYNKAALAELLQKEFKDKYLFYYNSYFTLCDRQADTYQDVLNCLKQYAKPVTYEQIFEEIWYLPFEKIKQILGSNKDFVFIARRTYFYAPNLPVSENELEQIAVLISAELDDKSYISDVDLYNLLDEKCPMVLINTSDFSLIGLRNVLGYLLQDKFLFNGKIITVKDQQISLSDAFAEFCHSKETITLAEIKDFAKELETTINWNVWNTIRQNILRVSETEFIQFDAVDFNVSAIDDILETICITDYVPIQSVGLFMHFPAIGVKWNSYVLESYVYNLSQKFCLVNAGFVEHGCYGAIARKNSVFVNYQKLVVDALAHSNTWNNSKKALSFLIQEGYQSSRRFANIDIVVKEAKLLREQIEMAKE